MSIYGVIGPNGAGKTYYLRTLAQMPTAALAKAAPDTQVFGATPREYFQICLLYTSDAADDQSTV